MKYLKVWTDFVNVLTPLKDDEIGRLFLAMLRYAKTGEEPSVFSGNESFLWAVAKRDIDTMLEKDEKLRQNGQKGGIAKSKNKQILANTSKSFQSLAEVETATEEIANARLKEIKRKEIKRNENKSFLDDDAARLIQSEQNRVLDAAENAGFQNSNSVRSGLVNLYAEFGAEKVLKGIESCVDHGATNLAYLRACMSDKPKPGKKVPAQNFPQRDYSDVNQQLIDNLVEEINAMV